MKKSAGILLMLLSLLFSLSALRDRSRGNQADFSASGREMAYATPAPPEGTVRINEADLDELIQLPGIGETLARAIVEERERNGFFHYPEDVMAAKGIGKSKLNGMKNWLDMSEEE